MKKKPIKEYRFLLRNYHEVSNYVGSTNPDFSLLPQILISFCVFSERLLKIKLHNKNQFLPYRSDQFKDPINLVGIVTQKEHGLKTIEFAEALDLYRRIFPLSFTDAEESVFLELHKVRNCFVHSHKADAEHISTNNEEIFIKIATVWEKISKIAKGIFGEQEIKSVKPSKTYTAEDLRRIQEEEVRKLIGEKELTVFAGSALGAYSLQSETFGTHMSSFGNERCPRCDKYTFTPRKETRYQWQSSYDMVANDLISIVNPNSNAGVYKCSNCSLELTRNQYEIAKKIT